MSSAIASLPPHIRGRLADALVSGMLEPGMSLTSLQASLGAAEGLAAVHAELAHLAQIGASGPACAYWIREVERAQASVSRPDLVWSGPELQGVFARDTRRVYEELLGTATDSLWISSFAYFDGPSAFKVLAERMDAVPPLQVTLMLNIQRKWGDKTQSSDLVARYAERFWTKDWPGSRKPDVYYDPRSVEEDGPSGVLHAKAVMADSSTLFITSANLTEAALDRNIEIGLLVRDRAMTLSAISQFRALLERRLLETLPGGVQQG